MKANIGYMILKIEFLTFLIFHYCSITKIVKQDGHFTVESLGK